jgi:hypothetical protein
MIDKRIEDELINYCLLIEKKIFLLNFILYNFYFFLNY